MNIDFDISELVKGIEVFDKRAAQALYQGAGQAASALLNDAITKSPAVPEDEGTLRGSGSAFVNNNLVDTAKDVGGHPTPASKLDDPIVPGTITGTVGFNTPYAAYQHEGERQDGTHKVQNYTHSGTGAKFLEKPLFENAQDYKAVVAKALRKAYE